MLIMLMLWCWAAPIAYPRLDKGPLVPPGGYQFSSTEEVDH